MRGKSTFRALAPNGGRRHSFARVAVVIVGFVTIAVLAFSMFVIFAAEWLPGTGSVLRSAPHESHSPRLHLRQGLLARDNAALERDLDAALLGRVLRSTAPISGHNANRVTGQFDPNEDVEVHVVSSARIAQGDEGRNEGASWSTSDQDAPGHNEAEHRATETSRWHRQLLARDAAFHRSAVGRRLEARWCGAATAESTNGRCDDLPAASTQLGTIGLHDESLPRSSAAGTPFVCAAAAGEASLVSLAYQAAPFAASMGLGADRLPALLLPQLVGSGFFHMRYPPWTLGYSNIDSPRRSNPDAAVDGEAHSQVPSTTASGAENATTSSSSPPAFIDRAWRHGGEAHPVSRADDVAETLQTAMAGSQAALLAPLFDATTQYDVGSLVSNGCAQGKDVFRSSPTLATLFDALSDLPDACDVILPGSAEALRISNLTARASREAIWRHAVEASLFKQLQRNRVGGDPAASSPSNPCSASCGRNISRFLLQVRQQQQALERIFREARELSFPTKTAARDDLPSTNVLSGAELLLHRLWETSLLGKLANRYHEQMLAGEAALVSGSWKGTVARSSALAVWARKILFTLHSASTWLVEGPWKQCALMNASPLETVVAPAARALSAEVTQTQQQPSSKQRLEGISDAAFRCLWAAWQESPALSSEIGGKSPCGVMSDGVTLPPLSARASYVARDLRRRIFLGARTSNFGMVIPPADVDGSLRLRWPSDALRQGKDQSPETPSVTDSHSVSRLHGFLPRIFCVTWIRVGSPIDERDAEATWVWYCHGAEAVRRYYRSQCFTTVVYIFVITTSSSSTTLRGGSPRPSTDNTTSAAADNGEQSSTSRSHEGGQAAILAQRAIREVKAIAQRLERARANVSSPGASTAARMTSWRGDVRVDFDGAVVRFRTLVVPLPSKARAAAAEAGGRREPGVSHLVADGAARSHVMEQIASGAAWLTLSHLNSGLEIGPREFLSHDRHHFDELVARDPYAGVDPSWFRDEASRGNNRTSSRRRVGSSRHDRLLTETHHTGYPPRPKWRQRVGWGLRRSTTFPRASVASHWILPRPDYIAVIPPTAVFFPLHFASFVLEPAALSLSRNLGVPGFWSSAVGHRRQWLEDVIRRMQDVDGGFVAVEVDEQQSPSPAPRHQTQTEAKATEPPQSRRSLVNYSVVALMRKLHHSDGRRHPRTVAVFDRRMLQTLQLAIAGHSSAPCASAEVLRTAAHVWPDVQAAVDAAFVAPYVCLARLRLKSTFPVDAHSRALIGPLDGIKSIAERRRHTGDAATALSPLAFALEHLTAHQSAALWSTCQ